MKNRPFPAARTALALSAALALTAAPIDSWALGLGRLNVQSALGEALRAEIDITSLTPDEASTLAVRIAPPEAYRAAGVEYNSALAAARAVLARRADGRPYLRVTGDRAVQEPFVDVILELNWSSGRLVREFTLLFDPPSDNRPAPPVQAAAPVAPSMSPAPAAPAPSARAAAPAPAPRSAPVQSPAVAAAPAARPLGADEYRVRNGDTLSRIAGKTQRPGVVLDQMLVGLYRANPDAFIRSNMNRLKSGVVLAVPPTEAVKAITPGEARQVILAQSTDFNSFRRRLADGVPTVDTDDAGRQAKGKVSGSVDDRRQAAAASPDKLTLSGSGVRASAPEGQISKAAERKDSSARVAELTRNVEELKRLQQGASAAQAAPPATVVAAAPPPAPMPVPAPMPSPAAAPTPSTGPAVAVSPPVSPAPAPEPAAPAPSKPAAAPTAPPTAAPMAGTEPGFLSSLSDSPYLLPGAGALVLALLGLGYYRFKGRHGGKDRNDTSFLESRAQPDSFFGASGGQRVDTTDASAGSSSMGFSLSQLDAIGDVDPVAEADVYLAYGRDLQAEEILKEAMRANPERMAVRTKLLEVYAKRRDTKGFELLAVQLFSLTKGAGADWEKAQAMGLQIDPENPLYQPGGHPEEVMRNGDKVFVEPLGATTLPASTMPRGGESEFGASLQPPPPDSALDLELDLELDLPGESPASPMEATRPLATGAQPDASAGALDFDFSAPAPLAPKAAAPASPTSMDFDLDSLSLDLPGTPAPTQSRPASDPTLDFGNFALSDNAPLGGSTVPSMADLGPDSADPIARKLELAEEFRQIGDLEGARDLLEEVVAKSSGALNAKARGMLDNLG